MNNKDLIKLAYKARDYAYVPYSGFKVGAALITDDEKIYTGCNIESASYSPTICAERTAIAKCISDGNKKIKKIAVVGREEKLTFPCGVCRQFILEFGKDIEVIVAKNEDEYESYKIHELLPKGFSPEDLK